MNDSDPVHCMVCWFTLQILLCLPWLDGQAVVHLFGSCKGRYFAYAPNDYTRRSNYIDLNQHPTLTYAEIHAAYEVLFPFFLFWQLFYCVDW